MGSKVGGHKLESLNSDPQLPQQKPGIKSPCWGGRNRMTVDCWSVSLAELVSSRFRRDHTVKNNNRLRNRINKKQGGDLKDTQTKLCGDSAP